MAKMDNAAILAAMKANEKRATEKKAANAPKVTPINVTSVKEAIKYVDDMRNEKKSSQDSTARVKDAVNAIPSQFKTQEF